MQGVAWLVLSTKGHTDDEPFQTTFSTGPANTPDPCPYGLVMVAGSILVPWGSRTILCDDPAFGQGSQVIPFELGRDRGMDKC